MKRSIRAVAPRTGHPQAHEVTVAEEQPEYMPLTVEWFEHPDQVRTILTRWKPNDEQRARIAAGEDVYVTQLNFNGRGMTPMNVWVGSPFTESDG
jgi:hypothetical protein